MDLQSPNYVFYTYLSSCLAITNKPTNKHPIIESCALWLLCYYWLCELRWIWCNQLQHVVTTRSIVIAFFPRNLDSTNFIEMFRAILAIATLAGAAAFAPVSQVARSSSLKMSFESEIGAQPPLGFWDPLGLLDDADQARFDRLRIVENKHGRISMLAILGHLVTTAGLLCSS